jgi:cell division septum initiation protein DivIVA
MARPKTAKRKDEVAIGMGGGPYPLVPLPGARNIRTLSAQYIADLQDHWERHGMKALDEYREKFVERYVENYAMLARIIRVEADVKHSTATPKTVDEALAELESKVGVKGRRKFEKFLREVGADEDEIEVTPK